MWVLFYLVSFRIHGPEWLFLFPGLWSFQLLFLWINFPFLSPPVLLHCFTAQSCPILYDPIDCSLPGTSVHGDSPGKNIGLSCRALLQGIFPTQGSTQVFHISGRFFTVWASREAHACSNFSLIVITGIDASRNSAVKPLYYRHSLPYSHCIGIPSRLRMTRSNNPLLLIMQLVSVTWRGQRQGAS